MIIAFEWCYSSPWGYPDNLTGFTPGGSRPTPSPVRGGGGGTGRPTWSARPNPLETRSRKDTSMKPSIGTLRKITSILEGGIPSNRGQLQAMASRLKDEILELIKMELRMREKE